MCSLHISSFMGFFSPRSLWIFQNILFKNIYLFGCTGSWWWHLRSSLYFQDTNRPPTTKMFSPTQSLSQSLKHTSIFHRAWWQQKQLLWGPWTQRWLRRLSSQPKEGAGSRLPLGGTRKLNPDFSLGWTQLSGLGSAAVECGHRLQGEEFTHLPSPRVGTSPSQHPWGLRPLQAGRPPRSDTTMPREFPMKSYLAPWKKS